MFLSQSSYSDRDSAVCWGNLPCSWGGSCLSSQLLFLLLLLPLWWLLYVLIEGRVESGLTLGSREAADKCFFFFYLLQKKKVTVVLLNDYVLKPPPKYLCLCLSIRAALSLFAVTTLNVETHNSSKHRKQVTTEGPCINSISTSLPPRLREIHGRGGGEGRTARLRRKVLKMLSSGHDKAWHARPPSSTY